MAALQYLEGKLIFNLSNLFYINMTNFLSNLMLGKLLIRIGVSKQWMHRDPKVNFDNGVTLFANCTHAHLSHQNKNSSMTTIVQKPNK